MTNIDVATWFVLALAFTFGLIVGDALWHSTRVRRWLRWRLQRPQVGHPDFAVRLAWWRSMRPGR